MRKSVFWLLANLGNSHLLQSFLRSQHSGSSSAFHVVNILQFSSVVLDISGLCQLFCPALDTIDSGQVMKGEPDNQSASFPWATGWWWYFQHCSFALRVTAKMSVFHSGFVWPFGLLSQFSFCFPWFKYIIFSLNITVKHVHYRKCLSTGILKRKTSVTSSLSRHINLWHVFLPFFFSVFFWLYLRSYCT